LFFRLNILSTINALDLPNEWILPPQFDKLSSITVWVFSYEWFVLGCYIVDFTVRFFFSEEWTVLLCVVILSTIND
jgi:hypothetical protein